MISGYIAYLFCRRSRHLSVIIDVSVLLLGVYLTFYIGEHVLHVSGVLATVFFGILLSRMAPHAMSHDAMHTTHIVFGQVSFFAETHIFVLAGLIIEDQFFSNRARQEFVDFNFAFHLPVSLVMYFCIHVIRASVIMFFSPLLTSMGYGVNKKEVRNRNDIPPIAAVRAN